MRKKQCCGCYFTTPKSSKGDLILLQSIAMLATKAPSGVWGEKKDDYKHVAELMI